MSSLQSFKPAQSALKNQQTHIYLVDDETMIGEVVEALLKLEGYRSEFFQDPMEAWQSFVRAPTKPQLLLTDFMMASMNGMELIQRCKGLEPKLRTILYSGNVSEKIMRDYPIKPDSFLSKPFLPKMLIATVESVLRM